VPADATASRLETDGRDGTRGLAEAHPAIAAASTATDIRIMGVTLLVRPFRWARDYSTLRNLARRRAR